MNVFAFHFLYLNRIQIIYEKLERDVFRLFQR
jgi:hypothetical protein